jgi:hypothetical protein
MGRRGAALLALFLSGIVGCDDFGSPQLDHHETCDCNRPPLKIDVYWSRTATAIHDDVEVTICQGALCVGPALTSIAAPIQAASANFPFSREAMRVSLSDEYTCPVPTDELSVHLQAEPAALSAASIDPSQPLRLLVRDPVSNEQVDFASPTSFSTDPFCLTQCRSYRQQFTLEAPGCRSKGT